MAVVERPTEIEPQPRPPGESSREQARKRLESKRDFVNHLVAYVVVNAAVIGVWALTGGGYFWPAWLLTMWGAGLVLHAWSVFWHHPVTEEDIDAELRRHV
jgi:hypothetical protein